MQAVLTLPVALCLLLTGCAPAVRRDQAPAPAARLKVVTTVAPVTLLTRSVAGDCAEVTPLLPPGSGPHGFQSRPQDLLRLQRARLLVINGLGLESFLEPLLRSAGNPSLTLIDSSQGIRVLAAQSSEWQAQHASGARGPANPHIWLDPQRAIQQLQTIRDGLIRADPACAAGYRRRADRLIDQLRQLDAELAAMLTPLAGRSFVVLHDFAPYFAERYRLKEIHLLHDPEQPPAPSDLRRVSEAVRRGRIRALLRPPQEASAAFDGLARDLSVGVEPFSPLEILTAAELDDAGSYARLMRANAAAMRRALAP
ncbi:MAG: zinc ABC transporter substrate-binding protein [Synechococcaceae cyanobacterium]|nr:zinc ABC transporter substrate-binding protein [Synechococcaceae cyanobacterium]